MGFQPEKTNNQPPTYAEATKKNPSFLDKLGFPSEGISEKMINKGDLLRASQSFHALCVQFKENVNKKNTIDHFLQIKTLPEYTLAYLDAKNDSNAGMKIIKTLDNKIENCYSTIDSLQKEREKVLIDIRNRTTNLLKKKNELDFVNLQNVIKDCNNCNSKNDDKKDQDSLYRLGIINLVREKFKQINDLYREVLLREVDSIEIKNGKDITTYIEERCQYHKDLYQRFFENSNMGYALQELKRYLGNQNFGGKDNLCDEPTKEIISKMIENSNSIDSPLLGLMVSIYKEFAILEKKSHDLVVKEEDKKTVRPLNRDGTIDIGCIDNYLIGHNLEMKNFQNNLKIYDNILFLAGFARSKVTELEILSGLTNNFMIRGLLIKIENFQKTNEKLNLAESDSVIIFLIAMICAFKAFEQDGQMSCLTQSFNSIEQLTSTYFEKKNDLSLSSTDYDADLYTLHRTFWNDISPLLKPLKEHITIIENEIVELESKIKIKQDQLKELSEREKSNRSQIEKCLIEKSHTENKLKNFNFHLSKLNKFLNNISVTNSQNNKQNIDTLLKQFHSINMDKEAFADKHKLTIEDLDNSAIFVLIKRIANDLTYLQRYNEFNTTLESKLSVLKKTIENFNVEPLWIARIKSNIFSNTQSSNTQKIQNEVNDLCRFLKTYLEKKSNNTFIKNFPQFYQTFTQELGNLEKSLLAQSLIINSICDGINKKKNCENELGKFPKS